MTKKLLARAKELADPDFTCDSFRESGEVVEDGTDGVEVFCDYCGNFEFRHIIKALLKEIKEIK
jgi:hypothetical protein